MPPETEELTEREEAKLGNLMQKDTEEEIFHEALGSEELDNDGDDSLEQMEDPVDEAIEDEDVGDGRADTDVDQEEEEELEAQGEDEGEGEEGEGDEEQPLEAEAEDEQSRDERGRFVPPSRLREEADRRRLAESEAADLRQRIAAMETRMNDVVARAGISPQPQPGQQPPAQPQPQAQPQPAAPQLRPAPDPIMDPQDFSRWLQERDQHVAATVQQSVQQALFTQQLQRADIAIARALEGERGVEVRAAYDEIIRFDPRTGRPDPAKAQAAQRVAFSSDPVAELLSWWEQNGGQDWLEEHDAREIERLQSRGYHIVQPSQQRRPAASQQQRVRQPSQQTVGHEVRLPPSLQRRSPPSLNAMGGSQSHQMVDPEMLDGSEEAIFSFGTRR